MTVRQVELGDRTPRLLPRPSARGPRPTPAFVGSQAGLELQRAPMLLDSNG